MDEALRAKRIEALKGEVEMRLPDMARLCTADGISTVVMSQYAFAADFQDDEYRLLGMVIKYIGLTGRDVLIGSSAPEGAGGVIRVSPLSRSSEGPTQ